VTALLWADWPNVLSAGRIQLKEKQQYKKGIALRSKTTRANKNDKTETVYLKFIGPCIILIVE
jgi:hypothetical protein